MNTYSPRIGRLLLLIQELKAKPVQTPAELREKLGISKAQLYKDRELLKDMGFEFDYDRKAGKDQITQDRYWPVEDFSFTERLALLMAVRQLSAAGDSFMTFEGVKAARKLLTQVPAPLHEALSTVFNDLIMVEGFGCRPEILETLQQAISEQKRLILFYKTADQEQEKEYQMDPYHIFFQRRALYLEGYCPERKDIRMFRLNRIRRIQFTGMYWQPQEGYDFVRRHRNAFAVYAGEKTEKVVVRFGPQIQQFISEVLWHHSQKITANPDGSCLFEVEVAEPREVMWWALGWGAKAEILEPEWLRGEAKDEVEKMLKRYKANF